MNCPILDIVIVDYNSGPLIRDCLESVSRHRPKTGLGRVVVVDNGRCELSSEYLESLSLPVLLIRNECNKGFAAACNQGARACGAEYLLFLNPDTRVMEGALDRPLGLFQQRASLDVGIVGVQLVTPEGTVSRSCRYFPRANHFWNKALGLDKLSPHAFPNGEMLSWDHLTTQEVDQVMGACFFVRRSVYEALMGFDERFFVYYEEVDFSVRAYKAGYRCVFLADVRVMHIGGGTTEQIKAVRCFYALRSRLLYAYKHFRWLSAFSVVILTLIVEPLSRATRAVLHLSWANLVETFGAYRMLYQALPSILRRT